MAMGTCRCRPAAERHSAAAATGAVTTGAVAIGTAVTNSSLRVDMVLRSSTGIPLTGTIRTATTAIKGIATATATKGIATAMATKGIATATNGRSKKGKYVSEADAINEGDRPAPRSHFNHPYSTRCSARDSFLLALLTMGEGYHNYHHEFQHHYRNGVKPWQFDPTKWLIWTLSKLRLVRNLRRVPADKIESAQAQTRNASC